MANETKQYAQWIDVPDGKGGLERKWLKDAEAQEGTLYPVDVSALTPTSTFRKNAVVGINGVFYRAKVATSHFPVVLVLDDVTEQFVIEQVNGKVAFVIDDPTVHQDWEVWTDAGIEFWIAQIGSSLTALAARVTALETTTATALQPTDTFGGYQAQTLLTAVASLIGKTVVLNDE